MKKVYALILFALATNACIVVPEQAVPEADCAGQSMAPASHLAKLAIDSVVAMAVEDGLVGGALLVRSKTKGEYVRGFGFSDLRSLQPSQVCQKYRVASLTKVFTATLTLMLVEEGAISLDTRVGQYLDDSQVSGITDIDEITVAQLLNHTSGIPNYDDDSRFAPMILNEPGRPISLEQKLGLVRAKGGRVPEWVIKKFGQIYSNTNYLLLQLIIEKAEGKPFEQVLRSRILSPLNLNQSMTSSENPYPDGLARGYVDFYGDSKMRDVNEWDAFRFDAEGNMITTVQDLGAFFDALLSGRLISNDLLTQMKDQRLGLLQEEFELENAIGHDGIAIGYSAEMWYLPRSGLTVILLANQGRLVSENWSVLKYENLLRRIIEVAR